MGGGRAGSTGTCRRPRQRQPAKGPWPVPACSQPGGPPLATSKGGLRRPRSARRAHGAWRSP
eukprot:8856230-Alexandrium_andersonii.AAC.1